MTMDPLQKTMKRTQRYWFEDGLWDIGFGFALLVLGLFLYLPQVLHVPAPLTAFLGLSQIVLVPACFFSTAFLVRWLKERITYPRTGYISYRKEKGPRRWRRVLLGAGLAMVLSITMVVVSGIFYTQNLMALIVGLVMTATTAYIGLRFDVTRYYALSLLTLLVGAGVSFGLSDPDLSAGLLFVLLGLLWLACGLMALFVYLRTTRQPEQADNSLEEDL